MNNNKVAAEAKRRVKHYFNQDEGFHVGVSRDEWGCFDSYNNAYSFVDGHFYTYGRWWIEHYTNDKIQDIIDYWDRNGYGTAGHKEACFAVVDRKRKIAVIKEEQYYSWYVQRAIPDNFTIYFVKHIPCYDICASKNKNILIKEVAKALIINLLHTYEQEYKVINSNNKYCNDRHYGREDYFNKIKNLADKYKRIPRTRKLWEKGKDTIYIGKYKVALPGIDDVLNDNLFTDEQKVHIEKCKFYTDYCYANNLTSYGWKDVDKNWNTDVNGQLWQKVEIGKYFDVKSKIEKRFAECKVTAARNRKEAIDKALDEIHIDNPLDAWRKHTLNKSIQVDGHRVTFEDVRLIDNKITWFKNTTWVNSHLFDNTQLKLNNTKTMVVTSRSATVKLDDAIKLFNTLYLRYMVNSEEYVDFTNKNIYLGYYQLRHIAFKEKYADDTKVPLGYKEWQIQIGCHTLWLDDIKEFVRYYNLEDKVAFPANVGSQACIDMHIVHVCDRTDTNNINE